MCSPDGLQVIWPNGQSVTCSGTPGHRVFLCKPEEPDHAKIYWGLLQPQTVRDEGLYYHMLQWKSWFSTCHPYAPPSDPLHVTMYYDRQGKDELYEDAFNSFLKGREFSVTSPCMYVHKTGVVASIVLPNFLMPYYKRDDQTDPHCSLFLGPGHEAREMGPLTYKLNRVVDWKPTPIPDLFHSVSQQAYKVQFNQVTDRILMEDELLQRSHGRELTDHECAEEMLSKFPNELWAKDGSDIGKCLSVDPVVLTVQPGSRVYVPQRPYRTKQQFDGVDSALRDLWKAGVLEFSDSTWNTPLNPVPKPDGTFRPAHDLRKVNNVTTNPTFASARPTQMSFYFDS